MTTLSEETHSDRLESQRLPSSAASLKPFLSMLILLIISRPHDLMLDERYVIYLMK